MLGAEARLVLHHQNPRRAKAALAAVLTRVTVLENIFSLMRPDSDLVRLNTHGHLSPVSRDMHDILVFAKKMHRLTGGVFDPSIQPLFRLYADHFAAQNADPAGPPKAALARILAQVGFDKVDISKTHIAFAQSGMALSLNGIAQGYITDAAHRVLATYGLKHALVNFGEYRALGPRPSGQFWRIGLAQADAPWRLLGVVPVQGRALATSAGAGTQFDAAGRFTHLINPHGTDQPNPVASVSVMAPSAVLADALSTALAIMPISKHQQVLAHFPTAGALITKKDGDQIRVNFPDFL